MTEGVAEATILYSLFMGKPLIRGPELTLIPHHENGFMERIEEPAA